MLFMLVSKLMLFGRYVPLLGTAYGRTVRKRFAIATGKHPSEGSSTTNLNGIFRSIIRMSINYWSYLTCDSNDVWAQVHQAENEDGSRFTMLDVRFASLDSHASPIPPQFGFSREHSQSEFFNPRYLRVRAFV